MPPLAFDLLYLTTSIATVYAAHRIKAKWSERNFTIMRFRIAISCSFFLIYCHLSFFFTGDIPFTDIHSDSWLSYLSLFFALCHFFCIPRDFKRRTFFRRKDWAKNMVLNEYPNRSISSGDLFFYYLKVVTFQTRYSAFYSTLVTVGIILIANIFIKIDESDAKLVFIVVFLITTPITVGIALRRPRVFEEHL